MEESRVSCFAPTGDGCALATWAKENRRNASSGGHTELLVSPASPCGFDLAGPAHCQGSFAPADSAGCFAGLDSGAAVAAASLAGSSVVPGSADPFSRRPWKQLLCDGFAGDGMAGRGVWMCANAGSRGRLAAPDI